MQSRVGTSRHSRSETGRKWPTPVFLPGESQGRGSLAGCRLWGHIWSRGWSRATRRLSAVRQRSPLPKWGLSPVLPLLSYGNKPCLPPLPSKLPRAGVGSQAGMQGRLKVASCADSFPHEPVWSGVPCPRPGRALWEGRWAVCSVHPGEAASPTPPREVCRGGGNWVAISCACGPGELATWSSGQ